MAAALHDIAYAVVENTSVKTGNPNMHFVVGGVNAINNFGSKVIQNDAARLRSTTTF